MANILILVAFMPPPPFPRHATSPPHKILDLPQSVWGFFTLVIL